MKLVARLFLCLTAFAATACAADGPASNEPASNEPAQIRDRILKLLHDENPEVVERMLDRLEWLGRERSLAVMDRLIELAGSESLELRVAAIERLGEIGPEAAKATAVLERRLDDPDASVRLAAATAAWRVTQRAERVMPVLLQMIGREDRWYGFRAAEVIAEMGPSASVAVDSLVELTRSDRRDVRTPAVAALGRLGSRERNRIEPPLQAALDDDDEDVRIAAARAISRIDGRLDRAVQVLTQMVAELVKNAQPENRVIFDDSGSAVDVLGKLQGDAAPATSVLTDALSSPSLALRLEAVTALGRIGPSAERAIPALSKAMRETETHTVPFVHSVWCVGDNAAEALGLIGAAAVPTLIAALRDDDVRVQANAIKALGLIRDESARTIGPLTEQLHDRNPLIRIEAAKVIGRLGPAGATAASDLAGLLVDDLAFTSFRAGMGIGDTESVRDEAFLALQQVGPEPKRVLPALVRSLEQANDVPYELIAALRLFRDDADAAIGPLERLLGRSESRVGAAAALAVVDPKRPGLRRILEDALVNDDGVHPIAAVGLGQLAVSGEVFDERFRQRLHDAAVDDHDLFALSALLHMDPTNARAVGSLMEMLKNAHSVFDAIGIREAELTLRDLARHRAVRDALVGELTRVHGESGMDEVDRLRTQEYERLRAAGILISAGQEIESAIRCLDGLVGGVSGPVQGHAADILAVCRTNRDAAVAVLLRLLDNDDRYAVGGDFYGNGGERRVAGDRAARALVALKATEALQSCLASPHVDTRLRVIHALGQLGAEAVDDNLVRGAQDSDFRIRRATMATLGRLGREHASLRETLRPVLESAVRDDRRRSVRDEAKRALSRWK